MKERIQAKIEEIVDYIINKPVEEVTLDEYTVLTNELKGIEYKQTQSDNSKRMAELMSAMVATPAGYSIR